METLKLSFIQAHLHWENPTANKTKFEGIIKELAPETDLIILPEMFTTGFTMNAKPWAESMSGPTINWIAALAKEQQVAITGSIIVKEAGAFYNRLIFAHPDGTVQSYDKRHCFTLAGEHEVFTQGNKHLIVAYKGFRICPLICYDLRFPVWARNTHNYDVLIYVANWPKMRINAWDTLLKARAIENMSYCIGVNRVGLDANGYEYNGHSACYDALGELQSIAEFESEFTQTITLSKAHIERSRSKLKFLDDKDDFSLLI
jgi:predicted amidohydrolase